MRSSYRGRGRQTIWDGEATVDDNEFEQPSTINFWNLDKRLTQISPQKLNWKSLTTGGFAGIDVLLQQPYAGTLFVDTPLVKQTVDVADIGLTPMVFENGGIKRQLRIYRLPDENGCRRVKHRVRVPLHEGSDNAIYLRATTEDGFFIYSSPVYVVCKAVS